MKAGVKKHRLGTAQPRTSTPFGRASTFNVPNLIQRLSRPKPLTLPTDPFSRPEFRGMPYADQLPAWRKLVTGQDTPDSQELLNLSLPGLRPEHTTQETHPHFGEDQVLAWMRELDVFAKFHKKPGPPSASQIELGDVMRGVYSVRPPRP